MANYSGNIADLQWFKTQLDQYASAMHQEIAVVRGRAKDGRGRVRDGAVSGAINDFIDRYDEIDAEVAKLEGASKELGALIMRFQKAQDVWNGYSSSQSSKGRTR